MRNLIMRVDSDLGSSSLIIENRSDGVNISPPTHDPRDYVARLKVIADAVYELIQEIKAKPEHGGVRVAHARKWLDEDVKGSWRGKLGCPSCAFIFWHVYHYAKYTEWTLTLYSNSRDAVTFKYTANSEDATKALTDAEEAAMAKLRELIIHTRKYSTTWGHAQGVTE